MTIAFRVPVAPGPVRRRTDVRPAAPSGQPRLVILSSAVRLAADSRRDPGALLLDCSSRTLARQGRTARVSRKVMAFVVALAGRPGAVVPNNDMLDRLYAGDPDGGPLNGASTLSQLTQQAGQALAPLGLGIETEKTRGRWLRCSLATLPQQEHPTHG